MSRFSVLDVDDLGEVSATISGKLCFPEISTFKFGLGCVQLDSETWYRWWFQIFWRWNWCLSSKAITFSHFHSFTLHIRTKKEMPGKKSFWERPHFKNLRTWWNWITPLKKLTWHWKIPPCLIGNTINTSSFMVDFPASYVRKCRRVRIHRPKRTENHSGWCQLQRIPGISTNESELVPFQKTRKRPRFQTFFELPDMDQRLGVFSRWVCNVGLLVRSLRVMK